MKAFVAALLFLGSTINADVYMQAARGSNNRLDERGRERDNANRLFDSQNNNRGGYNVGHMTYYTGETIPISWTNQHSSGTYQLKETELILQYTCDPLMRDGTTTNRIPDDPEDCQDYNCDTDVEYGRHESWSSYQYCKASSRNKGLFTANQNMNGRNAAIYTRQDNDGTRYGYECTEERDYYPYWRPSVWRDMAIYTNTVERCEAYEMESQNVKSRWQCVYKDDYWMNHLWGYVSSASGILPLDEYECLNMEGDEHWYYSWYTEDAGDDGSWDSDEMVSEPIYTYKYEWKEFDSFGIDEPECTQTRTTRVNHHGLPGDRGYWTHNWVIPEEILDIEGHDQCCVVRLRYNITTDDYQSWDSDEGIGAGLDMWNNSWYAPNPKSSPDPEDDPAWVKIWEKFDIPFEDVEKSFWYDADDVMAQESRGYVFRNDPHVDPFGIDPIQYGVDSTFTPMMSRILLQLAINTDQFGRTFQDRTHCFSVKDRLVIDGMDKNDDEDITLVTVQGKRGNIVQVYPATEYFFIPEPAVIFEGSWVHFCWTGSNTNPHNNDGQGLEGSDRSNICPATQQQWDKEAGLEDTDVSEYGDVDGYLTERAAGAVGDPGNNYPDWLVEPAYGMPTYYNYAPKRDLPRVAHSFKSATGQMTPKPSQEDQWDYPYNDPYNKFWFSERGKESQMADMDIEVLAALCTTRKADSLYNENFGLFDYGNMEEFDDAGTTFCIEPVKVTANGKWNFICTRNNNFSNRSQKGSLVVGNAFTETVSSTSQGYRSVSKSGQAKIVILPGMVEEGDTLDFTIITWANRGEESTIAQITGSDGGEFATDAMVDDGWVELWVPYTGKSLSYPRAYYKESADDEWKEHSDASIENEKSTTYGVINISKGGYYIISNEPDILAYIAVILGMSLFGISVGFLVKKNCVKK